MKVISIVVLCTLAAAVMGAMTKEEAIKTLRTLADSCLPEAGATEADLDLLIKSLPATNMETKCLRACVMKKVNMLTPDGKFDKANSLKLIDIHMKGDDEIMKIAREVADICENISVPDNHCEAAELYEMCLLSEAKKRGVNGLD